MAEPSWPRLSYLDSGLPCNQQTHQLCVSPSPAPNGAVAPAHQWRSLLQRRGRAAGFLSAGRHWYCCWCCCCGAIITSHLQPLFYFQGEITSLRTMKYNLSYISSICPLISTFSPVIFNAFNVYLFPLFLNKNSYVYLYYYLQFTSFSFVLKSVKTLLYVIKNIYNLTFVSVASSSHCDCLEPFLIKMLFSLGFSCIRHWFMNLITYFTPSALMSGADAPLERL